MSKKSNITETKVLRSDARKHLERGTVTNGYADDLASRLDGVVEA